MATYPTGKPTLDTYAAIVSTFSDFLTVAIHTILYERNIYPPTSFLSARKYNYPVRQSRHPKVCKWIQDAVSAVEVEMLKCTIARTSLIIYSPGLHPLERFIFSTASFPLISPTESLTPFEPRPDLPQTISQDPQPPPEPTCQPPTSVPLIDLEEQFRAIFSRLSLLSRALSPLPPHCSFTLAVELREQVPPPIGHPQPWIPAQPRLQPAGRGGREAMGDGGEEYEGQRVGRGSDLGG
ncbi:MAG: hypothetical protein FRX48_08499 [Lasallia pustulata]|uniref:HORMA domain-containing protein n=1 Tax=Lasallia pustulata TaxID=136370 RepID=A0A5M8PEC6_9LECA|nr:MAG: hypothetical protein FRX48_08499 [Lasallia pustulata]